MLTESRPHLNGSPLTEFDLRPRTRVLFGPNVVDRVGDLALELNARQVLLVTDTGIVAAGHAARVRQRLEAAGLQVFAYEDVQENPTESCVDKCAAFARNRSIDVIIGLGGGSSMDTAKGCNFVLTSGGRMRDYCGVGKARARMLPLIAIPTTGGTGSECQSYALITNDDTHQKMACGDTRAAARIALLDPTLTLSQPPGVTACTGVDAITHAIESAVTTRRNALSLLYSREAFRLTFTALPRVLASPMDLEARGLMLLGAAWAGTAIENSMLGAAHATANPLTARYGIVHGQAVGMMLPNVIRFNAREPRAHETYAELAVSVSLGSPENSPLAPGEVLARAVEERLRQAGFPQSLAELGVEPSAVPTLAREASLQWTAKFNPRSVTTDDLEQLYMAALAPADTGSTVG